MEALFVLLIFSLILGIGFLVAFFWAHNAGQYEDTETPAIRMLFEDAPAKRQETAPRSDKNTVSKKTEGVQYGG